MLTIIALTAATLASTPEPTPLTDDATDTAAEVQAEPTPEQLVYLEADPLAYINRGFSIHPGYENWGLRFDLTIVRVDFPEAYETRFFNPAFDLITGIQGVKVDWVGERSRGLFAGLDLHHQGLHVTHRDGGDEDTLHALFAGPRIGYKLPIYKGLYVSPWAAVWRNLLPTQSFSAGGDTFTTNPWDVLITLHLGYALPVRQAAGRDGRG